MGDMERVNHQSSATSSSSIPKQQPNQHLNPALIPSQLFRQPFTGGVPPPIPPMSPYSSQIPATLQLRHSRSVSQPNSYFSFDSVPPFNPSLVSAENALGFAPSLPSPRIAGDADNLPPRKSHRRSSSDDTYGFMAQDHPKSPPLMPSRSLERSVSGGEVSDWSNFVQGEAKEGFSRGRRSQGEAMDDVVTAYMNLDNIDVLNYGGENGEELESSRGSGTKKTNGGSSSDSEGESSASATLKAASTSSGVKRRAGGDIAPTGRHQRSLSVDSGFMGKLGFDDESSSLKLPPSSARVSPTNSGEGNSSAYSVEFGNGDFTAAEMHKISADVKLSELAMTDPKRAKRVLANRVSAARSKERKAKYIAELEHKVQTLQTEATTLSAQLTHLQRDSVALTNQNDVLKFHVQALEKQAPIRKALYEQLTQEVRRLKLLIGQQQMPRLGGCSNESNMSTTTLDPEMFQQLSISQLQHQQMQHTNQNSSMEAKHSSNE